MAPQPPRTHGRSVCHPRAAGGCACTGSGAEPASPARSRARSHRCSGHTSSELRGKGTRGLAQKEFGWLLGTRGHRFGTCVGEGYPLHRTRADCTPLKLVWIDDWSTFRDKVMADFMSKEGVKGEMLLQKPVGSAAQTTHHRARRAPCSFKARSAQQC